MKTSKKATSIVEAMVVMLIVTIWVVWMYKIFFNSSSLIDSTKNKIRAMSIAREGIEAMTNIRDTNWLTLWSDYKNCWNTYNYNSACVWNTTNTDIPNWSWWYIIYKDTDNRWELKNYTTWNYTTSTYRNNYKVWLSWSWFYTQTWTTTNLKPVFTREIKINYIDTNWTTPPDSNDEKMKITSLVQWSDRSSKNVHKIRFEKILSNWKNK